MFKVASSDASLFSRMTMPPVARGSRSGPPPAMLTNKAARRATERGQFQILLHIPVLSSSHNITTYFKSN